MPRDKAGLQASRLAFRGCGLGQPVKDDPFGADTMSRQEDGRCFTGFSNSLSSLSSPAARAFHIEADAGEDDLAAWMEAVSPKIGFPTGVRKLLRSPNLEKHPHRPSVFAQTIPATLELSSQVQEALSVLEGKSKRGCRQGRLFGPLLPAWSVGKDFFQAHP